MIPVNIFLFVSFVFTRSLAVSTSPHWSSPEECKIEIGRMTCVRSLPYAVPRGITEVEVQELSQGQLNRSECVFCDPSWMCVKTLRIASGGITANIIELHDEQFKGLVNLEKLYIHLTFLTMPLPKDTFLGLDNVTALDMSNCQDLSIDNFMHAMANPSILPKLTKLILHKMNSLNDFRSHISVEMTDTLAKGRNISEMDVSNTHLIAQDNIGARVLYPLRDSLSVLNVSNTVFLPIDPGDPDKIPERWLGNNSLDTLDISEAHSYQERIMTYDVIFINRCFVLTVTAYPIIPYFTHVKTLYASDIANFNAGKHIYLFNITFKSSLKVNLKHLDISNNRLKWMDCVIIADSNRIESMDASNNDMEYIRPELLQQACTTSLKTLSLSHNMLFKMQSNESEFETLISHLIILEDVNLSYNNLTHIPKLMFANNIMLHVLNLSNNKLSQITFAIEMLTELQYFDITENSIVCLDSIAIRSTLDNIFNLQVNGTLRVNMHGNPLECASCSSAEFVRWVFTSPVLAHGEGAYECESEHNVRKTVDEYTVRYVQDICDRNKILLRKILMSTLIPVASLILIVLTVKYIRISIKKRRFEAHVDDRRQHIEDNVYEFKYPIFLSYSSLDEDVVLNHLYIELHHQLRVTCRTDRELVCVGDRHFRPGYWVADEVARSLEMSALLVVILSRNYCDSDWCKAEVQQAYQLHKPMLLISIEHVDERDMPPPLREHFQKHVRVQFVRHNDGTCEIIPEWNIVCTSILGLLP